jgi:hypothetical protein
MADFHAADLWVAVAPDVSKVGPAMQEAGTETHLRSQLRGVTSAMLRISASPE